MRDCRFAAVLALLLAAAAGCGGGGINPPPIQMLIYVSGGTGLQFMLPDTPDPAACGSEGTGIQAPNASHQFPQRIFTTPYLFILNNVRQPVQMVLQAAATNSGPIRVDTFLGENPQNGNVSVDPGDCQTILSSTALPPPTPVVTGSQFQVEVCSPNVATMPLAQSCVPPPLTVPLPDRNIAYFVTIGDIKITYISNCILTSLLDACRSPTTMFFENPRNLLATIISVNSGQNPDPNAPPAAVRLELYQDGQRIEADTGTNPQVSSSF